MASLEGLSPEAIANLAGLANTLASNPETRAGFLGLVKKADPSVSIPEVDMPLRIDAAMREANEKVEKLERALQERDARDNVMQIRNSLVTKGLASEADIPEVEKLMLEKGISSHETAAEFLQSQKRSAIPTPSSHGYNVQTMPKIDTKDFGGNLRQWGRATAAKVIDDMKAGRIVAGT